MNGLSGFGCALLAFTLSACQQWPAARHPAESRLLWQADLGDGRYQNPILHLDYSDPDVVAVNGEYYMTASSFNSAPGLPILHSTDLVNWRLINYALPVQLPEEVFARPQHGNGVWAPNIRYHDGKFWIFYPDPDFGIYVTTAADPAGDWSKPRLILAGKGLIDPTPMWEDGGKAWLLHGWAKSRAGFNNVLSLREMDTGATKVSGDYINVVDGHQLPGYRTLEGPKFYRRNGYYYIFAPAGGVEQGWQSVFRARDIRGPYEARRVMEQGQSLINGPHQGSWIHTEQGEDWFIHFQSRKAYGRIVHLQPMLWRNDWPVIGEDPDGDGIGQPVYQYRKPATNQPSPIRPQPTTDEFNDKTLGLQWQWNANPKPGWYQVEDGRLRLYSQAKHRETGDNLWMTPSVLLQKLPAQTFEVRTQLDISQAQGAQAGLLLFGEDYAWIGVSPGEHGLHLVYVQCSEARTGCDESMHDYGPVQGDSIELRMVMQSTATALFSYRFSGQERFEVIGEHFQAVRGRWVGAKIGLFSVADAHADKPYVDVDYMRFAPMRRQ